MSDRCTLLCADAFGLLASLADGAVDCVITDPPYDEHTHKSARSGFGEEMSMPIDFPPFTAADLRRFVTEGLRVSKRWIVSFCALEQLGAYKLAAEDREPGSFVRSGVWVRHNGPQVSGDRPAQGAEGLAIMHRPGRKHWNGGGMWGVWHTRPEHHDRCHPTQKPLDLMLALISDFTDLGELVLDPFAGSGTTAIACLRLGRRFLGCEIDPAKHAVALERLAAEGQGLSLAAARAGQLGLFGGGGV